ncbi:MAG: SPASM domain-containing protein, partial [Nanoarchaeota archaeon]|nr:SPASM domain-containing protein [Nanoarchaeota archaeon]
CSCAHCPVGMIEPSRRNRRFGNKGASLRLYKKIIEEIVQHPSSVIRIHSVGEPLLWKDLTTAAILTKKRGVKSWLFTSAVTSDKSLLKTICENIDIIEVSVNSTDARDYEKTKGVDSFDLVLKNIQYLHLLIKNKCLSTRLIVSRVQSTDKRKDEAFVDYWKKSGLVDDAFVRTYHTYNDLLTPLQKDFRKHEPCLVHWARFNISVAGQAIICFNEVFKESLDPSLIIGDVNRQTIADIWHGAALTALRQAELSGDYSDLPFKDALPCKDCYSCQPLSGNRQTSEHQMKQINLLRSDNA